MLYRYARSPQRDATCRGRGMSKKVLFIDRDGTIIVEPPDQQIDSLHKLALLPDVVPALLRLRDAGYKLTNGPEHADVVIFNTCSVRERAAHKVFTRIGEVRRMRLGSEPVVGVMG